MSHDIENSIKQRNVRAVFNILFEKDEERLKSGSKTENEYWDYKKDCPPPGKAHVLAWADLAKEILSFHNNKGGILIFGIDDDYSFCGATNRLDSKLLNDQLRKFIGDRVWVEFHREFIQNDQKYLGIALIPPRGPSLEKFRKDAPADKNGNRKFKKGFSAIREGDTCRLLNIKETIEYSRKIFFPTMGKVYEVDEPFYRILCPEYNKFVIRKNYCDEIEKTIRDPRISIASVTGIGGVGKTAISTWIALRAYERKDFAFIVAITAKDRELTSAGIAALKPELTSFESLLNSILDVLEFSDKKYLEIKEKEKIVKDIIENSDGLLYVDNLETVDDIRIVEFLNNLPLGVHAITTSRRVTVKVSTRPIEIGTFTDEEVLEYINILSIEPGMSYLKDLSESEILRIGNSCDRIPLAIKWALCKSSSPIEALSNSEQFSQTGKHGEELLEFCFRGIFSSMPGAEKSILYVLSLFQKPLPLEAILIGTDLTGYKIQDTLEILTNDSLIQTIFEPTLNDYVYTTLPIVKTFVKNELKTQNTLSEKLRKKLSDYYEAKDIKDTNERIVIRELRQGINDSGLALIDLAKAAEKRGDNEGAKNLYDQAISRDPNNYKVIRAYAEFCRHKLNDMTMALQLYDRAASNAPRQGSERAIIFRERGILYRDSGFPDATEIAIENFVAALDVSPNDPITIHALAHMYDRKGNWYKVIEILEPLRFHSNTITRKKTLPVLLNAYKQTNDIVKFSEIKSQLVALENELGCDI